MSFEIRIDDLRGEAVAALLREHLAHMHEVTPQRSVHALDLDALRAPDITFWTIWDGDALVGCGALREIAPTHGEIKSMRTVEAHRGRGVASRVVEHLLEEASRRGYTRVSLETGAFPAFAPARALYARHGFVECAPFAGYAPDENSMFMTRVVDPEADTP
ncbi:MAG: GNAT family N-acetyltransferase [Sandaracinaceae bacterium]